MILRDGNKLYKQLNQLVFSGSARLMGIASVERFAGAPAGHHPCNFVQGARSVLVIGIPIPRGVMNYPGMMQGSELIPENLRPDVLQGYYYRTAGYDIINRALEDISLKITLFLEEQGFITVYFAPTFGNLYSDYYDKIKVGLFSTRHAAVRAGLGEFGLNNLVVNPRFGSGVRYAAVITEAELTPSPLMKEKVCLGLSCRACIEKCGAQAISVNVGFEDSDAVCLDPVTRTDAALCLGSQDKTYCFGRCLAVCPVGGLLQKNIV